MLSSIHPLGERARNNRWETTVLAFSFGAALTGAAIGATAGWAGRVVFDSGISTLWPYAIVIAAAGVLDLLGVKAPGPHRQVNEEWIGRLRGWVYGGAFGSQLGTGVTTFVVTWGVYALLTVEFLSADPSVGAAGGVAFGVGRSLFMLAAMRVDRPSRLEDFNRRLVALARPVHLMSGVALIVVAAGWMA